MRYERHRPLSIGTGFAPLGDGQCRRSARKYQSRLQVTEICATAHGPARSDRLTFMPSSFDTPLPVDGLAAPWFIARCTSNERYHFASVAGRYVVLCFFQSASNPYAQGVLEAFLAHTNRFDDDYACFFGVTVDPEDERQRRVQPFLPGYRFIWDFDSEVSKLYGAVLAGSGYRAHTLVLDERLRAVASHAFVPATPPEQHVAAFMASLARLPPLMPTAPAAPQAPVLLVPRVFEPAFCESLIAVYEQGHVRQSGFMQEKHGKTVQVLDDDFKRRRDCVIEDDALRKACRDRLNTRLLPEVRKAFQFAATYAERYLVACYDSIEGGFFRPHRDNTTKGTAHRRFAVTINLNTGNYRGGHLQFPEFARQTYEAPLGGAIVFSCSLLHAATAVTEGRRYAFLPFLYDEPAAKIREQNLPHLHLPEDC